MRIKFVGVKGRFMSCFDIEWSSFEAEVRDLRLDSRLRQKFHDSTTTSQTFTHNTTGTCGFCISSALIKQDRDKQHPGHAT